MSKYLVTMTDGGIRMSSSGHSFRNDLSGTATGHLNIITKFVEFDGDVPTEREMRKLTKYHQISNYAGYRSEAYAEYHILYMQRLTEDE